MPSDRSDRPRDASLRQVKPDEMLKGGKTAYFKTQHGSAQKVK